MNKEKVFQEVAKVLKVSSVNESSSSENIESWDSLGQLGILVALDNLFSGKVASIQEMAMADSMEKILGLLKKNSLIS